MVKTITYTGQMYVFMNHHKIFKRGKKAERQCLPLRRKILLHQLETMLTAEEIFSRTCPMSQITVYFSPKTKISVFINRMTWCLHFTYNNREVCPEYGMYFCLVWFYFYL